MTFDLLALGAIALFALWGAFTGFARQVAQAVGMVAAFAAALPLGEFFSEPFAQGLKASLTVGTVAATIFSFVIVYLVVRGLLTWVLKRLLAKRDEDGDESYAPDRLMGFGLGALKAAALVWVGVSAATFIEDNLVLNGRRFTFTPRDSKAFAFGRSFNLFETLQFSGGKDLALAAKLAVDPTSASRIKNDPDYVELMKDSRFKNLVSSPAFKKAIESGDVRALMQNETLLELVRDPKQNRRIERLAERAPTR